VQAGAKLSKAASEFRRGVIGVGRGSSLSDLAAEFLEV